MSFVALVDYGCHLFTYRLAVRLRDQGTAIRYFLNGSLESPNRQSLADWARENPALVRNISCRREYGKMHIHRRFQGELEWAGECVRALAEERPSVVVISCVPLTAVTRIQFWARRHSVPLIYWLQDLQGRAMHELLGAKFGFPGRIVGSFADIWEQEVLERSRMVITIAAGHDAALPQTVRSQGRHALLENWANIDELPVLDRSNDWSRRFGLDKTRNVLYAGTLGMKHDLKIFGRMAAAFNHIPDVRIVVVSSGQAADQVRQEAARDGLSNLIVLPFQPNPDVAKVLASAAVLVASLDPSAGGFCVPSKVLSYLCAGRTMVIALDEGPVARMVRTCGAGVVVRPGDTPAFVEAVADALQNPDRSMLQGRAARVYAEQLFDLDTVATKFLRILNRAVADLPEAHLSPSPGNS
jgi:glycosyltransferase involved in cell wall biosynthesis